MPISLSLLKGNRKLLEDVLKEFDFTLPWPIVFTLTKNDF